MRSRAAEALGKISPVAEPVVPVLATLLMDVQSDVLFEAADALIKIGFVAAPFLVDVLEQMDIEVRRDAARALARIGPEPKTAVPLTGEFVYRRVSEAMKNHRPIRARSVGARRIQIEPYHSH